MFDNSAISDYCSTCLNVEVFDTMKSI